MKITKVRAIHLKAPIESDYQTTFDKLRYRQAVLILIENDEGYTGIGETYVNFPVWAPTGRLYLFKEAFFPEILGKEISDIPSFTKSLWKKFYRASLQGNSLGATMQALSAVSCALWDLTAKSHKKPLCYLFKDNPATKVKVYGSGINPPFPEKCINDALEIGIDTFKLKLGYGDDIDKENIKSLKKIIGNSHISVDVNRSWSFEQTLNWLEFLEENHIEWLEEPLSPPEQCRYKELFETSPVPISAGENFLIPPGTDFITEKKDGLDINETNLALNILQPAVVKNCCFDDAVKFISVAERDGKKIFPHFLGSAPGTALSSNLASLTNEPHLEWDINPNPLRTDLFNEVFEIEGGYLKMPENPGVGWSLDVKNLKKWIINEFSESIT